MPESQESPDVLAKSLVDQMTLGEKLHQMTGSGSFLINGPDMAIRGYNRKPIPAGGVARLGVPELRFTDGPRGVVMQRSTCFPVAIARGASFDTSLEARIGDAIGVEARTQGANFFAGVCINALRHPAWGRAQETYGEDPHHLGEMGVALIEGTQRHVMACVKHFAANSIENARFKVDVQMSERVLREVYLPHFKRCIDAGVASVMSAYNRVNGDWCGHHHHLLTEVLKDEWGFDGFVMSDFVWGIRDAGDAIRGGLDIEMPFRYHIHRNAARDIEVGLIPEARVTDAAERITRQKIRFSEVGEPHRYLPDEVAGPRHRALAREAAQKSMVLLKNDLVDGKATLPIGRAAGRRIAVIGRLAKSSPIGDHGSSRVRPPHVVTPLQGIEAALSVGTVAYASGSDIAAACELAENADVAVVVAGYRHNDEGENIHRLLPGGDRSSLRLRAHDEELIGAVARAQPATVVVMIGGSAIITEPWREQAAAILMAWYPGMEGGHALADLLFGAVAPSGRLPCEFPRSETDLVPFDPDARVIEYTLLHGYRHSHASSIEPAWPFGFGLSYTTFGYRDERARLQDGVIVAEANVTNTGAVDSAEVVQVYMSYPDVGVLRPVRELKGFTRVEIAAGVTASVSVEIPVDRLSRYDEALADWVVDAGSYTVWIGSSSAEHDLTPVAVAYPGSTSA